MASNDLMAVMSVIVKLSSQYSDEEAVKKLTTAFRKLRNKCAEGPSVQNDIASFDNLVDSTFVVLQGILDTDSATDSQNLCLLVGLQMIANLLIENKEFQVQVWERYQKKIISCLWYHNPKVQNCAVMILYNVFLGHPEYIVSDKDIFIQIIHLLSGSDPSEFGIYLIQLYIKKTKWIEDVYHILEPDMKLILLGFILDYIVKEEESLGEELVSFLVEKFVNYSENFIDELAKTENLSETLEIVKILHLLSTVAGNGNDLKVIQSKEALLITSINLLKTIHNISKEPGNNLSRIQRLSELDNLESQIKLQEDLSFGVKGNLIRLIGNLCWKNKSNQNKVLELEAIPVLLDCCAIDGRNPFILQWAILAIRNLCDDNKGNQKFIASIGSKGEIDVNKMKEMGILLNRDDDGNSLSIAPLKIKD